MNTAKQHDQIVTCMDGGRLHPRTEYCNHSDAPPAETQPEDAEHSPLPWKLHIFNTMQGETQALNCVGKSMCGRDWTCYITTADGDSVAETYGATKEEAIGNAHVVLHALEGLTI